jgi:hypothetical protein
MEANLWRFLSFVYTYICVCIAVGAASLKQQSVDRHVAPLWNIILIPSWSRLDLTSDELFLYLQSKIFFAGDTEQKISSEVKW